MTDYPIKSLYQINRDARFLEALATNVDVNGMTLTCESVICDGNSCEINEFIIPYDRLLVTIGAQTNTFGIPGVREYCNFLKQVEDARRIRTAIVNCFERANLPGLSDEERINILTFAVIGKSSKYIVDIYCVRYCDTIVFLTFTVRPNHSSAGLFYLFHSNFHQRRGRPDGN